MSQSLMWHGHKKTRKSCNIRTNIVICHSLNLPFLITYWHPMHTEIQLRISHWITQDSKFTVYQCCLFGFLLVGSNTQASTLWSDLLPGTPISTALQYQVDRAEIADQSRPGHRPRRSWQWCPGKHRHTPPLHRPGKSWHPESTLWTMST